MSGTMAVSAALALVAAAVYAYAAKVVHARPSTPENRPAMLAFSAWWASLAVMALAQGVIRVLALVGTPDAALVLTQRYLVALLACVAVTGLLYYFVYLRWGSRARLAPILLLYGLVYVYYLYAMASSEPGRVIVSEWRVEMEVRNHAAGSGTLLPALLLVIPPIAGAAFLWPLVSQSPEPEVRYRGRLISSVIIGWLGSALLVGGIPDPTARALVSHGLGLAAVILTLLAYHPPAFLRRRWERRAG